MTSLRPAVCLWQPRRSQSLVLRGGGESPLTSFPPLVPGGRDLLWRRDRFSPRACFVSLQSRVPIPGEGGRATSIFSSALMRPRAAGLPPLQPCALPLERPPRVEWPQRLPEAALAPRTARPIRHFEFRRPGGRCRVNPSLRPATPILCFCYSSFLATWKFLSPTNKLNLLNLIPGAIHISVSPWFPGTIPLRWRFPGPKMAATVTVVTFLCQYPARHTLLDRPPSFLANQISRRPEYVVAARLKASLLYKSRPFRQFSSQPLDP
ncbi:hypothetical protein NDU88_001707 [Pleurodeles waltl]|uniref:Uncharacterized protein n=1 Tax=Pleurodeles waltl TaxID=8319 RepID=A0AAV7VAS6_PLEWA|nr:hypothetical protein NDU88_001707 [Pleurodeles waltl]